MGQQQVETRRSLRQQCLIYRDRVAAHINGAQDARVQMPVFGPSQQGERLPYLGVAAAPVSKVPVQVIRGAIAIQRHADQHAIVGEQRAEGLVQPDAVGMDPQVEPRYRVDRGTQRAQQRPQPVTAE
jgi:hypothetical protein